MKYRGYSIEHVPKPIPGRRHAVQHYDYWPDDYDGPEDGRGGAAASVEEAKRLIDGEIDGDDRGAGVGRMVHERFKTRIGDVWELVDDETGYRWEMAVDEGEVVELQMNDLLIMLDILRTSEFVAAAFARGPQWPPSSNTGG